MHPDTTIHILAPAARAVVAQLSVCPGDVREVAPTGRFEGYAWDDRTGPAREFEVRAAGLGLWADGILEVYSGSSQFDRLRAWRGGAVWGLAVAGDGFHGQYGRRWRTGPGNLHLSLVIPCDLPIESARVLQRAPAEKLADFIDSGPVVARVRAPNDVVICRRLRHGVSMPKKVAGTLTELRTAGDRIVQVRYGIGMNLRYAPPVRNRGNLRAAALCDYPRFGGACHDDGMAMRKGNGDFYTDFASLFGKLLTALVGDFMGEVARWPKERQELGGA